MPSLTQLKKEIQFHDNLGSLLNILKSIATQQFQSLEASLRSNPTFFDTLMTIAGTFDLERFEHPFNRASGPLGIIAITSDVGLLGGLNQQVILTALREYRAAPGEFMVVGRKGLTYAREHGVSCREFPGFQEEARRPLAAQVRDYALNGVLQGRLGSLTIVHPRALSFTIQRVEVIHALPARRWLLGAVQPRGIRSKTPLLLESPAEKILEYLVWVWLGERLYEALGASRLAELAARSVHLEGSLEELKRRRNKLLRRYFHERHEVIDRGMRELFAARALYGSS